MKKLIFIILCVFYFQPGRATIHVIGVWAGYYQFVPQNSTIQLGDTIQWLPYYGNLPTAGDPHTVTSTTIPVGAVSFNEMWQLPADTFFQYVPQVAGVYNYECTPHAISMNMIGSFQVIPANDIRDDISTVIPAHVFPNPAAEILTIEGSNVKAIDLYNMAGEKIYTSLKISQQKSTEINISTLPKGIYFAKIYNDMNICTKKIIVQ